MFKKPALLAAFGVGYVLGARAGRERYDAMVAKAQGLWQDPRVQEKAHQAKVMAEEKAESARHAVEDKMPGHSTSATSEPSHKTTPTQPAQSAESAQSTPPSPAATADPVFGTPRGWES